MPEVPSKDDLDALAARITELEDQVEALEQRVSQLEADSRVDDERIGDLESELAAVKGSSDGSPTPEPVEPVASPEPEPVAETVSAPAAIEPIKVITFDGPEGTLPSGNDWTYEIGGNGWGAGREIQTYTTEPRNACMDGKGNLVITARRERVTGVDGIVRDYTSARLTTEGKTIIKPGSFIESTITADHGYGVSPAWWLVGTNVEEAGWPECGEIDILENCDGKWATAAHMGRITSPTIDNQYPWYSGTGYSLLDGALSIGLYFDADRICWFKDRKLVRMVVARTDVSDQAAVWPGDDPAAVSDRRWPFDKDMYLVVNLAVAESTPPTVEYPNSMTIGPISIWGPGSLPPLRLT